MRILWLTLTGFLLLFFFLATAPSTAGIKSIKIQSDDRPVILFERFSFTQTGNITVAISAVSVTSPASQPDPARLAFFLLSEESLTQVLIELQQNPNFCVVDSKFITLLFTLRDLSPPPSSSFRKLYPVTYPGEYSLFFANCNPESQVTMDIHTELSNHDRATYNYPLFFDNYNPESRVTMDFYTELSNHDGATYNYLSPGLTQLPSLYFIFSVLYLCFLGPWIYVCVRNKRSVHQLHLLMGVLLIMKTLSLFSSAVDKHYVKVTGTSHGWDVLFYVFEFMNSVLSFTVIVLIGSGWPYLKPFLLEKEKKVLMIVIPLQVLANVASIVIGETGPFIQNWVIWNQVFLLADFICCCAIVLPVVWSIRSFVITDTKDARNNVKEFKVFCVAVIGYLLFTRIGVFALKIFVVYKDQWMGSAAKEIAGIVFYLVMFYMFKPVEDFDLNDEGDYEEAAELVKG